METTSKTKRIVYMTSLLYITFMFSTFIISSPRKVLTNINCDNYLYNQKEKITNPNMVLISGYFPNMSKMEGNFPHLTATVGAINVL